jgi:transcriptional regulator with XRE-family HTH domain
MNWSVERGAQLQQDREAAGISRRMLAQMIGRTPGDVKRWETTPYGPGPRFRELIASALAAGPRPAALVPTTRWALVDRFDGERLRQLRLDAGLGLAAFAGALGTDVPRLRRWETGRIAPGAHYAALICQELGCAPDDLCRPADQSHTNQAT